MNYKTIVKIVKYIYPKSAILKLLFLDAKILNYFLKNKFII